MSRDSQGPAPRHDPQHPSAWGCACPTCVEAITGPDHEKLGADFSALMGAESWPNVEQIEDLFVQ